MAPRVSAFTVRFDKGRAVSAPLYTGRRKTTVAQLRKFVVGEIGDVWYMMFINGYPSGRKGLKLHKGAYVEVWTGEIIAASICTQTSWKVEDHVAWSPSV